ncbi:MAG: site-specific DNA-methyltransferase [Deltaproteobacteria bacterium]|jgi:site-specific DNA-methyltransferase (adenine-specific)/adenine-specific DNA-methyltransferase|nr:site-specific DNA-methyltransferase [Deltaproteobacteria bacterium]
MGDEIKLSDHELDIIVSSLRERKFLPNKYRFLLFNNPECDLELIWKEKSRKAFKDCLPLITTELLSPLLIEPSFFDRRQKKLLDHDGWVNKLIWGDNKDVLLSLLNGEVREDIERQGGVKLIYIDPPFDVGNDHHIDIEIGDKLLKKDPSVLVEIAYRDTWGYGKDSFINMIYERLLIMHELLSPDGSLYLHCDWRISAHMREILDEVFKAENFINEIIWHYPDKIPSGVRRLPRNHDTIFFYAKDARKKKYNLLKVDRDEPIKLGRKKWNPVLAKWRGYERDSDNNIIYDTVYNKIEDDVWRVPAAPVVRGKENLGYPTQKPKELLRRIITMSSDQGDIVCDFFAGSGTTLEMAERLGRKWIGIDIGKYAINTIRKRMLGVFHELNEEGTIPRSWEILKIDLSANLPGVQSYSGLKLSRPKLIFKKTREDQKEDPALPKIIELYGASATSDSFFQAKLKERFVYVGKPYETLSEEFFSLLLNYSAKNSVHAVDVLAADFEIGVFPKVVENAKKLGIKLKLRYLPPEIYDCRCDDISPMHFLPPAKITIGVTQDKSGVRVKLLGYSRSYPDERRDMIKLKSSASVIRILDGDVVKITKDKRRGTFNTEVLTQKWLDWVDYWAVDFDFKRDTKEFPKDHSPSPPPRGGPVFKNHWQSFRTRVSRTLELKSPHHKYPRPGKKTIAVKVIDILGNDSVALLDVDV